MSHRPWYTLRAAGAAVLIASAAPSHAIPSIVNGGFEIGFAGWTRVDQVGSEGTFALQSGVASPVNGDLVPAAPGGMTAAMTDAFGPGAHVLYQDFVASAGPARLSFDLFIGNRATNFFVPPTLDFSTPALNQQVRVDIVRASADPFTMAGGDILQTLFASVPGDPLVSGYTRIDGDIGALLQSSAGQTLRLRFAETDNVFTMQMGVDNVAIGVIPEPSSALLLLAGLGPVWLHIRRRAGLRPLAPELSMGNG